MKKYLVFLGPVSVYDECDLPNVIGPPGARTIIDKEYPIARGSVGIQGKTALIVPYSPVEMKCEEVVTKTTKWVLPGQPVKAKRWRHATLHDCGKEVIGATWSGYSPSNAFQNDPKQVLLGMDKDGNYIVDRDLGGKRVLPVAWIYD